MSNRTTFTIKQGKTFTRRVEYLYGNPPTLFNMTEYRARMQIRPGYGSAILYCDLSSSIGPDGTGLNMTPVSGGVVLPKSSGSIGITISAFSSSQFTWKEGFFDLEIYSGSGVSQVVHEILNGKILVLPEITKS
jgi:hypothetical protein